MSRATFETRRWRKNGRRGVSPIIATILLVAITVVLAAVLYILISGLTTSAGSKPLSIQFGTGNPSSSASTNYDQFAISASSGLLTSQFGLKITNTAGIGQPTENMAGCANPPTGAQAYTVCTGTAGGWYALLTNAQGDVIAVYHGAVAAWTYEAGTTSVAVPDSRSLVLVSPTAIVYAGSAMTLAAFGTGSGSVSGSTTL